MLMRGADKPDGCSGSMQVEELGTGELLWEEQGGRRIEGIPFRSGRECSVCRAVKHCGCLSVRARGGRRELKTAEILLDLQWGYLPVNPW